MHLTTPAARRYLKRFVPTMAGYVVTVMATSLAVASFQPKGAVLVAISILPALAIIALLVVIGMYVREETDEYLRQRIVISMLFGIGVVLAISAVLGFLQIYRAIGQVDVFWAFPVWCGSWGMAQCFLTWRDRLAGDAA
jgi:small-conductance mechanosensitive channel